MDEVVDLRLTEVANLTRSSFLAQQAFDGNFKLHSQMRCASENVFIVILYR